MADIHAAGASFGIEARQAAAGIGADAHPRSRCTAVQVAQQRFIGGPRILTLLDAPLSRTPQHTWDGEATTYVGGPLEVIETWRPLLSTWANVVIPVNGPVSDDQSGAGPSEFHTSCSPLSHTLWRQS